MEPTDDAPEFRITNLRLTRGRGGQANLSADYVRLREGNGQVYLAGKTRGGPITITNAAPGDYNQQSGTIELEFSSFGGRFGGHFPTPFSWRSGGDSGGGTYDYELYFVVRADWAGRHYGSMLVSNPARLGNPGPVTTARPWTDKERAAYEKNKLRDIPPEKAPDGYVVVKKEDPLVPGMPIRVAYFGDWRDAEYLADADSGKVSIRFTNQESATTVRRENWLAARPETLSKAASNPSSFQPTIRVLPGGADALPDNLVAIPGDLSLPRGTPVLEHWGSDWEVRHVVMDYGSFVKVLDPSTRDFFGKNGHKDFETHSRKKDRNTLAIDRQTLQDMNDPAKVASFESNLVYQGSGFDDDEDDDDRSFGGGIDDFHVHDRDRPIKIAIPKRAAKVPDGIDLPKGTLVAYCWARRWEAATVVRDDGDKVLVKEKDSIVDIVFRMDRDQLIIQTKTLAPLKRAVRNNLADLKKTLRTWTDKSGQFKIEARFVAKNGDKVTIQTDAGREITLPLAKLSAADQELLSGVADEAENPFAQ
ncbi:MAG: SHD1 domain-containing protein [Planctomycetota bacterium]